MQPFPLRPVIVGAGVAGLTAALALEALGFSVRLIERAPSLDEIGAGIQLSPNATRLLERLGVLEALAPVAVRPEALALHSARSLKLLATIPLGDDAERRWSAPYLTVHRADLQSALLGLVRQRPNIDLTMGAAVSGAELRPGEIELRIDGDARTERLRSGLVIGADGVWSPLRQAIAPAEQSRHSGYIAWRAIVKPERADGPLLRADRVTTYLDARFHLVTYPIRGGEAINLVAVTRSKAAPQRWANGGDPAELLRSMSRAARPLRDVISTAESWTTWPIHEVPQPAKWTDPAGIVLIGDAAHAMSPYAAQGAAMAIEDAFVLATIISERPDDVPGALVAYEAARRGRIARVAARGRFNRFAWHAWGPIAIGRDIVLSLRGPERLASDLDWLYRWTPDASA